MNVNRNAHSTRFKQRSKLSCCGCFNWTPLWYRVDDIDMSTTRVTSDDNLSKQLSSADSSQSSSLLSVNSVIHRDFSVSDLLVLQQHQKPRPATSATPPLVDIFPEANRIVAKVKQVLIDSDALMAGKYRFLALLGWGGNGFVLEAENIETGTKVAVKFLKKRSLTPDAIVRPNLVDANKTFPKEWPIEAWIMYQMKPHPNIARFYDLMENNRFYFLVMERVGTFPGVTLVDDEPIAEPFQTREEDVFLSRPVSFHSKQLTSVDITSERDGDYLNVSLAQPNSRPPSSNKPSRPVYVTVSAPPPSPVPDRSDMGSLAHLIQLHPSYIRQTKLYKPIFKALVAALNHLHASHFVYLDMKCENVLMETLSPPCVQLVDFGMTRRVTDGPFAQYGTKFMSAPEILASGTGAMFSGPEADVWAVGVVLFLCATGGKPPFTSEEQVIEMVEKRDGKWVAKKSTDVSAVAESETQGILARILNPCPETRITCSQLVTMVQQW